MQPPEAHAAERVGRALVAVARPAGARADDLTRLEDGDWPLLVRSAHEQRVLGRLAGLMVPGDTRPSVVAARMDHLRLVAHQMRMEADLRTLGEALDDLGVGWAVLKGASLAADAYARPHERLFNDLDVLVDPRRLGDVLSALERGRCRLVDRNWPMIASTRRGELSVALWNATPLDLHWHVLNTPALRAAFHLPTADLLARSRRTSLGGVEVPVLARDDAVVYVALHACLAGAHTLGWLLDVALLADGVTDWTEVWRRARAAGADLALGIVLQRAAAVLEWEPPSGALAGLPRRSPWLRGVRLLDRRHSIALAAGQHGSLPWLVASTRGGTPKSLAVLSGQFVREVVVPRLALDRREGLADRLHEDVPSEQARHDYLAYVAAQTG